MFPTLMKQVLFDAHNVSVNRVLPPVLSRLRGESRHAWPGVNGDVHLPDSHRRGPERYSRGAVS